MDELNLKNFGFNKREVQKLYSDLIKLVNLREERAKSVKKTKRRW